MLVARATGEPLAEPSLYVMSEIRATNRAANTIEHVLRSILVLQLFLDSNQIKLENRFQEGRVLTLSELDNLVRHCRRPIAEQRGLETTQDLITGSRQAAPKIVHFDRRYTASPEVAGHTAANRVRAIRDYLGWLVTNRIARYPSGALESVNLWNDWERCKDGLNARVPRYKGRNTIGHREGLPQKIVERMLSVTAPESPGNPWKGDGTRNRNYLLIRWLLDLGLRRGELLNVKIADINFQAEELLIARRADDPEDPRRDQPTVKTRDRKLPLSSGLCDMTFAYITKIRKAISGARVHPFLFVSMGTGAPMSLSSLNKVFAELRDAFPGEFIEVTPHILRHTWNDRFSEMIDKKKISEPDEERMRSFLMGWSPTSNTAVTYTRRHVRRKAQEVSLRMQAAQVNWASDDD